MDIRWYLRASILWALAVRMKGFERVPPIYYLCPYLLGSREEPPREERHCLQASECGLTPWGRNRAVSGVCRVDTSFIFLCKTIVLSSLRSPPEMLQHSASRRARRGARRENPHHLKNHVPLPGGYRNKFQ